MKLLLFEFCRWADIKFVFDDAPYAREIGGGPSENITVFIQE
jgi:hypothetical protein